MKRLLYILPIVFLLLSCKENDGDIDSVEDRIKKAINDLTGELTTPSNGWKVLYQPTSTSGSFLMILDFDEDGEVRIRTDVAANDGEFLDQTINYRVDNSLKLELIFETYGIFHYLFELDQTTFGAEFEFYYEEKADNNLVFTSKTDGGGFPTVLTFEPASANDINLLSNKPSLWCSFSGSVKKHILNYNEIKSERGVRFFGPSKMSLINLIIHSFAIISVFKNTVFFRSASIIIILSFLNKFLGQISIMMQMLLVLFNIIIFIVSLRENQSALLKSDENILNVKTITH